MSGTIRLAVLMRQVTPYWEAALAELSKAWAAWGRMDIIAAEVGADPLHPWTMEPGERMGEAQLWLMPAARLSRRSQATIWPSRGLHRLLDELNPDVLVIQEYSPYSIFGGLFWAKARGKSCLVTTDVGPMQRLQFPLWQRMVHFMVNSAVDGVLAKTQDALNQSQVMQLPGLLSPHGVSTEFYESNRRRRGSGSTSRRIVQTGSLIHRKGVDLLLCAVARAREQEPDLELTLVGAGDHAGVRRMAQTYGLQDAVTTLDFQPAAELARIYAEHDLFVLASRFDTYGVVVHEAAAAGLPLVVSHHAGASVVLVRDGENGRVVDPEDTEAFASAILECLHPQQQQRYGDRSRALAREWDVTLVAGRTALWLRQFASRSGDWRAPLILTVWVAGLVTLARDVVKSFLRSYEQLWIPDAFGTYRRELVFLNRFVPFYREGIFRKLAGWKSTVLVYSGMTLGNLRSVETVDSKSVPSLWWGKGPSRKIVWLHALPQLWLARPRIVCTEHALSLWSTWGLFFFRPLLGFKLVFWTHGLQDYGWKSRKLNLRDRLRLMWLRWADAVIFYSADRLRDVEEITGPQPGFFVAPNALDVNACDAFHAQLVREGRERVRRRLGLAGWTVVYLGRLTAEKEPLKLAEFMRHAREHGIRRLEVIGGGELEQEVKAACAYLGEGVRFHGPVFDPLRRHELLFAADMLISPGYVGLNVADSLVAGCPVATLTNPALVKRHSPEITYVHEGFNGVLAVDIPELAAQVGRWLASIQDGAEARREAIRERFRRECSLESQFEGMKRAFEFAMKTRTMPAYEK